MPPEAHVSGSLALLLGSSGGWWKCTRGMYGLSGGFRQLGPGPETIIGSSLFFLLLFMAPKWLLCSIPYTLLEFAPLSQTIEQGW